MAHEMLTPEGRGVNGFRVESREGEGLTVPVLYNLVCLVDREYSV
jgi:hypothetical protein